MKRRTKRIIAGILSFVMFLSVTPITGGGIKEDGVLLNAFAAEQELEIWEEDIVSADDIEINGIVELRGDMTLLGDAKLIVNSGSFFVAPMATVEGDVELRHAAIFDCAGKLNGTLVIHSDTVAPTQEDWDGTMYRPNNAAFWENSYVRRVEADGYAFWSVSGICDELITMPGSSGDTYITPEATVKYVLAQGDGNVFNMGTVIEAEVTDGRGFDNGGYVENAKVTGGYVFYNGQNAYVKSMYVTDNGLVFNSQVHSEEGVKEGIIDTVVIESSVTNHVRDEKFHEGGYEEESCSNLINYGTVNNLFARGGSALNWGYMENVYLKDCKDFLGAYGWNTDLHKQLDTPYVVKNLLAEDSKIWLEKGGDGKLRTYGTITVDNGSFGGMDSYVEKLQVMGTVENVHLDNTGVDFLYLDAEGENENPYFVSLANYKPENVGAMLVDSEYVKEQKAAFNAFFEKFEYEEFDIPDYVTVLEEQLQSGAALTGATVKYTSDQMSISTNKDKAIPLQEGLAYIENKKQEEAWFKLETSEPRMIDISLKSYQTVSVVRLIDPDGHSVACSSGGETETVSCLAIEPGTYYLSVMGAEYGADLEIAIGAAPQLQVAVQYEEQSEGLLIGKKIDAALQEFDISLYDETAKRALTNYVVVDNYIYFAERLEGHQIRIDMVNEAMSWKYPALSASFEFREDAVMQLDLTTKEFGIYRGNVTDSANVRIYLYDATGNYMDTLPLEDGWFWSDYMKDGKYTAVFIRDAAGLYRFTRLSSFEEYGLKNHTDYIMDNFTIQAGSRTAYSNIDVPATPARTSEYLDAKASVIRANMSNCTAGGMVQVTMKYKVAELYAGKASNLVANFEFGKGTSLLGDVFSVNGEKSTDFVRNGQVVSLNLDRNEGSISFYASPEKGAETLALMASVSMQTDGNEVKEYVGNVAMDVVNLSLKAPEVTGSTEPYVYGVADPGIEVLIYEGDKVIGNTWSRANGKYAAKVRLQNCATEWNHTLYAKVYAGTEDEATTADQIVEYNYRAPVLDNFSMEYYVHGNRSEISVTGEEFLTKSFVYEYWPGTVFTFDVAFEDNKDVERVFIVSGVKGDEKELEAFYDEASGNWIATGQFSEDENYLPENFYIRYENAAQQASTLNYDSLSIDEEVDLGFNIESITNISMECTDNTIFSEDKIHSDELDVDFAFVSSYEMLKEKHTEEDILAAGFELVIDEQGEKVYCKIRTDAETMSAYLAILYAYENMEVSMSEDEIQLMSSDDVSLGEVVAEDASIAKDIYTLLLEVHALVPDDIYDALDKSIRKETGMSVADYMKKETEKGGSLYKLEIYTDVVAKGTAKGLKTAFEAWWDIKGYNRKLKDFLEQINRIQGLANELKSRQAKYPSKECLMYNADALIAGLDGLATEAKALHSEEAWFKGGSAVLDIAIGYGGRLLNKIVNDAIGKVVGGVVEASMKTITKTGIATLSRRQERITEFVADKVLSGFASYGLEKNIKQLTGKDPVAWMDDIVEKTFEHVFQDYANRTASISDRLNWIQSNLLIAISKCTPTPTPTVSPTPDPTEGPTPTSGGSPTPPPVPTTPPNPDGPDDPGDGEGNGDGGTISGPDKKGKADPSGYVYAGVRSNRVAGVKATVFYRDDNGNAVFWDAEEYDEINPQYTSPLGNYCWMVPQGDWKVTYELDGYETYETEWLPVPPPQTEVNINLMMTEAPALQEVFLNEEYAYITFNMYVQTESVDGSALTVSDASGNTYAGTLEAVNPEEEAGVMLADTYKLVFDRKAPKAGDNCVIALDESVIGYNAKKSVAEKQELTCKAGVKGLNAELPAYLPVGEAVTIPVQVEASSYEGMQLLVETEEAYIEVCSIGAINENGQADIVLKALRPGACDLRIKVADSEKMIDVSICCARAEDQALISYAENALAETQEETNTTTNWIWFAILAAALVLVAGTVCVIIIKKNKTRKNQ